MSSVISFGLITERPWREQAAAHAVDAVGGDHAVVRAAVPAQPHGARRADRALGHEPPDGAASGVDEVGGERVGLAHAQRELGPVLAPVPVGGEPALALQLDHGGEPLSRCATKKAPNVAATRARKTTRASVVTSARDGGGRGAGVHYGAFSWPRMTTTSAPSLRSRVSASIRCTVAMSSARATVRACVRAPARVP